MCAIVAIIVGIMVIWEIIGPQRLIKKELKQEARNCIVLLYLRCYFICCMPLGTAELGIAIYTCIICGVLLFASYIASNEVVTLRKPFSKLLLIS